MSTDQHPEYFSTDTSANGNDTIFTVQPVATAWPGDASHLFLRLKISPKHWLPFLAQLIFAVNTSFYKN